MSLDEKRNKILEASVAFVMEHGWGSLALEEASKSLKEDMYYWRLFFPSILEAVNYFESMEDARMLKAIKEYENLEGISNKIGKALFERVVNITGGYQMLVKLEEFYTSNLLAMSQNLPGALKSTWCTSDIIWRFAGDTATDFNHYTKRLLLSRVYISVVKEYIRENKQFLMGGSSSYNTNIEQYISDSLDRVVKWGKRFRKLQNIKLENIPIVRMFFN